MAKQRFLLVSDMHYTVEESAEELKRRFPEARASAASGKAFGRSQREKIEKIYEDILAEHQRERLDAVLVLGDLSIDDYDYRRLPANYCKKFREDCMDRLPCPAYAIPGNHDSYPDEIWREIFGYGREYVLELGEAVFVMPDTFRAIPADSASGGGYTQADDGFLREALEKHRGKTVFVCSHYFDENPQSELSFSEKTKELLRESKDVAALFRGHTHVSGIREGIGDKPIIDIGGYGYEGQVVNGKYDFNVFDPRWAWGYQILELENGRVRTYHVRTAARYEATNGVFEVERAVEDELVLGCERGEGK